MWAQFCTQCGAQMYAVPRMEPPADVVPPRRPDAVPPPAEPVEPRPNLVGVQDFRPHLTLGAVLAFVATLVIPPLFGGIAAALGYLAYSRGNPVQRRQGLWLIVASIACIAIGLALTFWFQQAGFIPSS